MHADAVPVLAIFEKKARLEVPLFQRQYVWNQEHQWEPLWEDLSRKFTEEIDGRTGGPVHFLGAMVLDQKQTPTTHVERRQVIDGQQRLTTLQVILAAFRDFCRANKQEDLADECKTFTLNAGMLADPAVDKYKVWPTQSDREPFKTVMSSESRTGVDQAYPLRRKPRSKHFEPRPKIIEAYAYFYEQLEQFFLGENGEPPIANDKPLRDRLLACFTALKNSLRVVVIDLDQNDDAQVIFETLNARGEPLLPADLLRNFIFLRAAREGAPQEALYEQYWRRFDDAFWRKTVKQGRLLRPRSDLFLQHFLASKQGVDIPVKHLFVEYKYWIEHGRPYDSITDELAAIARQGDHFRRIVEPAKDDPIKSLATFLDAYDIRTAYPLLLQLLENDLNADDWQDITRTIESYLIRRAICGLTTKNYNRTFLTLTKNLRRDGTTPANITTYFANLTGESTEWPSDEKLTRAWMSTHLYNIMNNPKIVHLLRRLNTTYQHDKNEEFTLTKPLTVEHILPQNWRTNWPLPDGSQGLSALDMLLATPDDQRAKMTRTRNDLLQTIGNLTILTQPLNTSLSNSPWKTKKPELLRASLLPINQQLVTIDDWNEDTITTRGQELLKRALQLWPRPTSGQPL